jgi:uncharacterized protein YlxW (UPF0749 family)
MKTQRTGDGAPGSRLPDVDSQQQQLQTLKARVQRLEKELEGLQDALYRHEVLQDKTNADFLRRTEQIEHHISRDAGRHLL